MKQHINLYQGHGGESKASFYLIIALLIALTLVAVAFSTKLQGDVALLRADTSQQQTLLADAKAYTEKMIAEYPKKERDVLLEKYIKQSQYSHQNVSDIMSLLSDSTSDKTQGFSRYFTAFAQHKTAGVWLKQVTIDTEKNSIILKGSTNNAENVPAFLQELHNDFVLDDKVFTGLNLNIDASSGELTFNVSSVLMPAADTNSDIKATTVNKPTAAIAAKIKGSH